MMNPSDNFDVLITDADQRVALEIARSLGCAGLKILMTELDHNSSTPLAAASKYCSKFLSVPSYSSELFIETCSRCDAIIPVSTNTIIACLSSAAVKFPDSVLLPTLKLFNEVNNKHSLMIKAKSIGVETPKTIRLSKGDGYLSAAASMGYPVVVKLADDEGLFLSPADRYAIVEDDAELENAWHSLIEHGKDILMQEYVNGVGVGFSALYDRKHRCVTSFQHKRLREFPPDGGPSTYCQSIFNSKIDQEGRKLLDALKWTGPAMVEFKYDEQADRLVLLEINPRYWGSLPLARHSGINIPLAHYNLIIGKENDRAAKYRTGERIKFAVTDILAAWKEFKRARNRILFTSRYFGEFFDKRLSWGLWSWRDPSPSLRYFLNHIHSTLFR